MACLDPAARLALLPPPAPRRYESYDAEGGADKPAASSIAPALLNAAGLPSSLQEAAAMRAARAGATGVGANPCAAIPSAQPGLSRAGVSALQMPPGAQQAAAPPGGGIGHPEAGGLAAVAGEDGAMAGGRSAAALGAVPGAGAGAEVGAAGEYYSEDEYYSDTAASVSAPCALSGGGGGGGGACGASSSPSAVQISVATAGNSAADPGEQAAVPAVEPSPAASSDVWALWSHERTQHVAVQRAQYLSQHERSFGAVVMPSAASVEAFLNIAVLGMREGGAAVLLNDPRGGGPAEVHLALSPPPEAGLRLVWAPADGAPDGHVRTLDIRQVIYCADVPGLGIGAAYPKQFPAHSRFTVVTSEVRLEFSMADPHCLQYFVCGLRHLANQPVARERFLWQRAAALHEEGLRAASFDERLLGGTSGGDGADSLSGFLSKQKAALESLPAER